MNDKVRDIAVGTIMKEIVEFFKKLFGDDFELKALSTEEGERLYIDKIDERKIWEFFMLHLEKNTIWYDPFNGILFSYKPEEDSFFKKVVTNAWAFKYIFYPIFVEGWGGWWSNYVFHIYEKGLYGNYKMKQIITNIG